MIGQLFRLAAAFLLAAAPALASEDGVVEGVAQIAAHVELAAEDLGVVHLAVDAAARAPGLAESWSETRGQILSLLGVVRAPADRVLLIGETALERDWVGAARLAGFVPAVQYFGAAVHP